MARRSMDGGQQLRSISEQSAWRSDWSHLWREFPRGLSPREDQRRRKYLPSRRIPSREEVHEWEWRLWRAFLSFTALMPDSCWIALTATLVINGQRNPLERSTSQMPRSSRFSAVSSSWISTSSASISLLCRSLRNDWAASFCFSALTSQRGLSGNVQIRAKPINGRRPTHAIPQFQVLREDEYHYSLLA